METRTLTATERDRFARNGFLVLRDAVPPDRVEAAYDAVADTVPEDMTDREELVAGPEDRHYWGDLDDLSPFGPINEALHDYAEQLVGRDSLESPGEFTQAAVRYPSGDFPADRNHETTAADGNAHVDIVQDPGEFQPFTVAATTYLDDVYPRAGGLTVWPGTHRRVADWFAANGVEEFTNDEIVEGAIGESAQPFEVCGSAGTVVLWHSLLVHTGGSHLGRQPRIAAFRRFVHRESEAIFEDAVQNPFEYWDGVES